MDDIVKRLRYMATNPGGHRGPMVSVELLTEAADEIMRLRKQVSDLGWKLYPDTAGQ